MSAPGPGRTAYGPLKDRCPSTAPLPPPAQVVGAAATTPVEPGRQLRCELAEGHCDEHAQLLWDDDRLGGGLWVRWTESRMYRVMLFWCTHSTAPDGEPGGGSDGEPGDVCGLFDGHQSVHSWRIIDTAEDDGPQDPPLPPQRGGPTPGGQGAGANRPE
ncbi:hypothetical protein ACFYPN_03870 [Streptomyces sp. NPDC005576]|uniref:hypothetical protein n=1 Tax=unclassified Streptomyces TaxID=2593676 RepID=UPI0033E91FB4